VREFSINGTVEAMLLFRPWGANKGTGNYFITVFKTRDGCRFLKISLGFYSAPVLNFVKLKAAILRFVSGAIRGLAYETLA
jgi:hypothetical protein